MKQSTSGPSLQGHGKHNPLLWLNIAFSLLTSRLKCICYIQLIHCEREKGEDAMDSKSLAIRMPVELLDWLRERAARETIRRNKYISINTFILELLIGEMAADREKGKV
jgi:hypothetical protein